MAKRKKAVRVTSSGQKVPPKKHQKGHQKELHSSADYFEALFRARFALAMKDVQAATSINSLAMQMGNARQAKEAIPRKVIEDAINKRCRKVLIDAFMRGGKLGAQHVKDALNA